MKHGSLFSGIGGFDLAAEWIGWENVFHCEWMDFPRKVLDYYWPDADSLTDITKTDFKKYADKIDILTGGFPCQPFSTAGQQKGKDDERYLWGEMLRAIQEIKPTFVIAENVAGILSIDGGLVFEQVCLDLETKGYEVQPIVIPVAAKNAPHRRDRVWFVATNTLSVRLQQCQNGTEMEGGQREIRRERNQFANGVKTNGKVSNFTNTSSIRLQGFKKEKKRQYSVDGNTWHIFPTKSPICGGDDGLPSELDGITFSKWRNESIKGYGNAIVPQVAYQIFKAIEQTI